MKKTLKSFGIKSLAALLSVLMILTALPLSAFAIGLESSDYSSVAGINKFLRIYYGKVIELYP